MADRRSDLPPRTVAEAARAVLEILAEGGVHTPALLAARLAIESSLVDLALDALAVSGRIEAVSEICQPVQQASAASACAACGMAAGCAAVVEGTAGGRRVLRRVTP